MRVGIYGRAGWASVCGLVLTVWGSSAVAQVTQTDAVHTPLPQPVSQAEADLVNNSWAWNANTMVNRDPNGVNLIPAIRYGDYYAPPSFPQFVTGDAIKLSGLFKWRKEVLDPVQDAKTGPGYFSGKCGFTAQLLLRGGNCQVQFGWYNVSDPTSKTPPAATEIYPFIIGKPHEQLKCVEMDGKTAKTDGFCPLAWDNRDPYDLSITRWTQKTFASGDLSKDPRYKGGYVGFAMLGDPAKCPQNKFSMYEHNQRNASGVPWVTTLIYQSTVDPSGFYMAFEDLSMSAADWKKVPAGTTGADGDFNDQVFYVSGLTCAGGNLACNTGQFGACSLGRTGCAAEGQAAACHPVQQASAEICDNVDNDCDGLIDDGAGLCPSSNAPICFHGACVASCTGGAFSCPLGLTCDASGRCVDPTCAAVSCPIGTMCHNGACAEACAGVLCPYGSQCVLGQCINPCAGVTCTGDRVCEKGLCVAPCSCNGCDTGLTCGADGRCVDAACAGKACASGTTCQLGQCVDPCAGVVCPGKGVCSQGVCSSPSTGSGGSAGHDGGISFGGSSVGGHSAAGAGIGGMSKAGTIGVSEGGTENAAGADDNAAGNDNAAGADAAGGTDAAGAMNARGGASASASGGVGSPGSGSSSSSSSCSFAAPGSRAPERALPVLALILGAAFVSRRRRRPARCA